MAKGEELKSVVGEKRPLEAGTDLNPRKKKRLENKTRKLEAYVNLVESNIKDKVKEVDPNAEKKEDESQDFSTRLPAEAFAELKRKRRRLDKLKELCPRMVLMYLGKASSLTVSGEKRVPLLMTDIQVALIRSLSHNPTQPRWAKILHTKKISQVVTVLVEGVSLSDILGATHIPDSTPENEQPEDAEKKGDDNKDKDESKAENGKLKGVKDMDDDNRNKDESGRTENRQSEAVKGKNKNSSSNGEKNIDCAPAKLGQNKDNSHANNDGSIDNTAASMEQYILKLAAKEISEGKYDEPAWLADVLPRSCHSMQFKVEMIAPAKYDVEAGEEFINIPLSERKIKNLGGMEKLLDQGIAREGLGAAFPVLHPHKKMKTYKIAASDTFDRRQLLLNVEDMYRHSYPIAAQGCIGYDDPDFVLTSDNYSEITPTSPMFGVDCEMCLTVRRQMELTSISVVNEKHELIYHKLVKPDYRIINYLTEFSGITAKMLAPVRTRLRDVQRDLRKLFPPDAILVGHSLNSDLKAMKMMHPYVIDSSLVYNLTGIRSKRTSLKKLTAQFLQQTIQDSTDGHDPTEDAAASLRLVQLKLTHDLTFGDVIMGWDDDGDIIRTSNKGNDEGNDKESDQQDKELDIKAYKQSTDEIMAKAKLVQCLFAFASDKSTVRMALLTTSGCIDQYTDLMTTLSQNVAHIEVFENNKELSLKTAEVVTTMDFTFAHMKVGNKLRDSTSIESRRHHLNKLDKQLSRIYKAAASKAFIFFVFTGSPTDVSADLCSNGFAMVGVKDMPTKLSEVKAFL